MLTLNGVNFISENDQFTLVSFFFKKEVFFVSHTTAKKLSRNLLHHKIFLAAKANAVSIHH